MPEKQKIIIGAFLITASEFMFASMGATVKAVTMDLPHEMAVFMRNFFGLVVLSPFLLVQYKSDLIRLFKTEVLHLHFIRAIAGLSAMYCLFFAVAHLPLAEASLLKMTAPIFLPIVALIWLKEKCGSSAILAIPIGFFGVILILQPNGDFNEFGMVGLLGGFLAAIAKVVVRRLGKTEPTTRTVFYFGIFGVFFSTIPLFWNWQTPTFSQWGLLIGIGIFGTCGQLLMSRGYALAPTASVAPFTNFMVIFSSAYGFIFWGETLDLYFLIGATFIVLAGFFAVQANVLFVKVAANPVD